MRVKADLFLYNNVGNKVLLMSSLTLFSIPQVCSLALVLSTFVVLKQKLIHCPLPKAIRNRALTPLVFPCFQSQDPSVDFFLEGSLSTLNTQI